MPVCDGRTLGARLTVQKTNWGHDVKQRIAHYIGNRGIVLGLLGWIWLVRGFGSVIQPSPQQGLPAERLPDWLLAATWVLPGLIAMVAVVWKKLDEWAWGLLMVPIGIQFVSFLLAWILGVYDGSWRGVAVYLAVMALINRCAAGLDRPAPWGGQERRRWTGQG